MICWKVIISENILIKCRMDDERKNFEKTLAKLQVEATFTATIGSVFALLGITLLVFGLTATLDSVSKTGEQITLFLIAGNVYAFTGGVIFFVGLALLLIGWFAIPKKINKMK